MFLNNRPCFSPCSVLSVGVFSIGAVLSMGFVNGQAQAIKGDPAVTLPPQVQVVSAFVPPRRGLPSRREGGGSR